jgi:hypothetical protein
MLNKRHPHTHTHTHTEARAHAHSARRRPRRLLTSQLSACVCTRDFCAPQSCGGSAPASATRWDDSTRAPGTQRNVHDPKKNGTVRRPRRTPVVATQRPPPGTRRTMPGCRRCLRSSSSAARGSRCLRRRHADGPIGTMTVSSPYPQAELRGEVRMRVETMAASCEWSHSPQAAVI